MKFFMAVWKYKKQLGYITAILTVAITLWQLGDMIYDRIYEKGRTDMRTELQQKLYDQLEEMRIKYEKQTQIALNNLAADHADEIARIRSEQEIKVITQKVIEYVDREIKVPVGCESVADDVIWVLQQGVHTIRSTRDESTRSSN